MAKTKHNSTTSLVYAQSLLDLAKDRNIDEPIGDDLKSLAEGIANDPGFKLFIIDPSISTEKRAAAFKKAFSGKIDPLLQNFLGVLAENRRLAEIDGVIRAFTLLVSNHKGETTAEVTTAHPLDASQVKALAAQLKSRVGRDVAIDLKVDPEILGGLKVKIGSQMIDSSIRTRLNTLAQAMKG